MHARGFLGVRLVLPKARTGATACGRAKFTPIILPGIHDVCRGRNSEELCQSELRFMKERLRYARA